MKDGLKYIVGKEIAAVVVASSKARQPRNQVFLLFNDGTCFELYGESFTCCGGLDKSEGLAGYIRSGGGEVVAVHRELYGRQATLVFSAPDPRPTFVAKARAAPTRLSYLAQRAWREAGVDDTAGKIELNNAAHNRRFTDCNPAGTLAGPSKKYLGSSEARLVPSLVKGVPLPLVLGAARRCTTTY